MPSIDRAEYPMRHHALRHIAPPFWNHKSLVFKSYISDQKMWVIIGIYCACRWQCWPGHCSSQRYMSLLCQNAHQTITWCGRSQTWPTSLAQNPGKRLECIGLSVCLFSLATYLTTIASLKSRPIIRMHWALFLFVFIYKKEPQTWPTWLTQYPNKTLECTGLSLIA